MRAKLIRGHNRECVYVRCADQNRGWVWYPDRTAPWLERDAAGGDRGATCSWAQFICPSAPKCAALCIVAVDSLLNDLTALIGRPVEGRDARYSPRDGLLLLPERVDGFAEEMAGYLFDGDEQQRRTRRLVLETDRDHFETRPGSTAPGWCRETVRDAIAARLRKLEGKPS